MIAEVLVVDSIRRLSTPAPWSSRSFTASDISCSGSTYWWCRVGNGFGFNVDPLTKEKLEVRDVVSLCY